MEPTTPSWAGVKTLLTAPCCSPSWCGRLSSIANGVKVPSSFRKRIVLVAYIFVDVVLIRFTYGISVSWWSKMKSLFFSSAWTWIQLQRMETGYLCISVYLSAYQRKNRQKILDRYSIPLYQWFMAMQTILFFQLEMRWSQCNLIDWHITENFEAFFFRPANIRSDTLDPCSKQLLPLV